MARRKRKSSSSFLAALVLEVFAIAVFAMLFSLARTEREREATVDTSAVSLWQGMIDQNPFENWLAQNESENKFGKW